MVVLRLRFKHKNHHLFQRMKIIKKFNFLKTIKFEQKKYNNAKMQILNKKKVLKKKVQQLLISLKFFSIQNGRLK